MNANKSTEASPEVISTPSGWIRDINIGESKTGKVCAPNQCYSFSTILARWNHCEGAARGIKVSAKYDYKNCLITITAKPINQNAQNQ